MSAVLKKVYASLRTSRTKAKITIEVQNAMEVFDVDNSTTLEFGEFLTMMATSPFFAFNQPDTTIRKIHPEVRRIIADTGLLMTLDLQRGRKSAAVLQGQLRSREAKTFLKQSFAAEVLLGLVYL